MKEYETLTREKVDVVPFGCGMPETHLMQDWGDKMLDLILNSPTINIGALVVLMGIPTAVTGFCFWMLEHRIQKREKQKEAEEAKRQKEAAARERAREDLQIITIQGTSAAIALGEATARAVQRIPDAHCNGDMHAALDYAAKIKHAQKDFLTSQGIHAIID